MELFIFDLDGVIFKSIAKETISDPTFWRQYWSSPALQTVNVEMIWLVGRLIAYPRSAVLFLTARPSEYFEPTMRALNDYGRVFPVECLDPATHDFRLGFDSTHLMMCNVDLEALGWSQAGAWKKEQVEALQRRDDLDVLFVVEDHKESADEIRKVVPVLLYEQLRRG